MATQELVLTSPEQKELAVPTPMKLIELAVQQGANADQLGKLMDMQLRWQAEEARLAWISDMAAFKAECPEILKTKHVKQKGKEGKDAPEYWHVELDKACEILVPLLTKHKFTHRWESPAEQKPGLTVTCVIQHKQGHAERTTLTAPHDNTGAKNAVQAVGSSQFYLERYTFLAALGIAPKGHDTDGIAGGIGTGRRAEQCEWIANCRNAEELVRVWKAAHEEASAVRDYDAVKLYLEAKDRRKQELAEGQL